MNPAPVLMHLDGALAILTLNNPEQQNVLNAAAAASLADAISRIEELVAGGIVRGVLLRAVGRSFCAGGDINEFPSDPSALAARVDSFLPGLNGSIRKLASLPVPVISALNGAVAGGGIGLAFCADIIIAAESMFLRGGYCAIGLSPDVGASWFLSRAVGPVRTKRILFANEKIPASECRVWGLITEVVPDAALASHAMQLALKTTESAVRAIGRTKSLIEAARTCSLEVQMEYEHRAMVACATDPESAEGLAAFRERRRARFAS